MAWSAPRTWVSGEIPTAAQLNTDLRDNLNELALHSHSGGSGSGTAALGSLISVTYIDAAAPAAPGGTLTRTYSSSTGFFWRNAGGIFQASDGTHEHSIASGTVLTKGSGTAGTVTAATPNYFTLIASAASSTLVTQTATFGGTGSRAVVLTAQAVVSLTAGGGTDLVEMRLLRDATLVATVSTNGLGAGGLQQYVISTLEYNRPAGSCTYILVFTLATTTLGTGLVYGRSLHVVEMKQA